MTEYEIPTLERTINDRRSRRSIADALEALRGDGHLDNCNCLEIRTSPLPSQTDQAPSLVLVVCHLNPPEKPRGVALPTSWDFRGRPSGKSTLETFEISRIDRARVDEGGTVTLSDGTRLTAVEVIPAALPWKLTATQKLIVYWTIKFAGSEDDCYCDRQPTRDLKSLDYAALRKLQIPKLAALVRFIAKETGLIINRQAVAYTLAVCGIRVPQKRSHSRD